jgi:hypothetical protein
MFFTWQGNPRIMRADGANLRYLPGYPRPGFTGTYLQPWNPPRNPGESRYWIGRERLPGGTFELERYDTETGEVELLGLPGTSPAWLPGQKQVVCLNGSQIVTYDLATKAATTLYSSYPNKPSVLRLNRDGTQVYFSVAIREGDIWLGRFPRP